MIAFYVLAALLLALLTAVIVAGVRGGASDAAPAISDAEARQRAALAQLADLEFEYQTGKLSEEEYQELKTPLARTALASRAEIQSSASGITGLDDLDDDEV